MNELEFLIRLRNQMDHDMTKAADQESDVDLMDRLKQFVNDTSKIRHTIDDRIDKLRNS